MPPSPKQVKILKAPIDPLLSPPLTVQYMLRMLHPTPDDLLPISIQTLERKLLDWQTTINLYIAELNAAMNTGLFIPHHRHQQESELIEKLYEGVHACTQVFVEQVRKLGSKWGSKEKAEQLLAGAGRLLSVIVRDTLDLKVEWAAVKTVDVQGNQVQK